jgi:secondary thiamine-phosphate synthase enzyme
MLLTLNIPSPRKTAFVEITDRIRSMVSNEQFKHRIIVAFVPHTTAGITINENADPNVVRDMLADLERLLPHDQEYYRHFEGNSASHLKASIFGSSVTLLVEDGQLALGTWQGIYLCEFDGPRNRRLYLQFIPDPH